MRPIPRRLLIHSAILYPAGDRDIWGKASGGDKVQMTYVRIDSTSKIVRDKNSAEIQLAAVLFYDCQSSRPCEMSFEQDQQVVFSEQRYRIQTVEPMYDEHGLHHYEIGLVRYAG